jgi:hypothetical protein
LFHCFNEAFFSFSVSLDESPDALHNRRIVDRLGQKVSGTGFLLEIHAQHTIVCRLLDRCVAKHEAEDGVFASMFSVSGPGPRCLPQSAESRSRKADDL